MRQIVRWKRQEAEKRTGMSMDRYWEDALLRGLTQEEMAKELDISRQTVNLWLKQAGYRPFLVYRKVSQ